VKFDRGAVQRAGVDPLDQDGPVRRLCPPRGGDTDVGLEDGLLVASDLDGPAGRNLIRDAVTRLLDGSAGANAAAGSDGASFAPSP